MWLGDIVTLLTNDIKWELSMAANKLVQQIISEIFTISKSENLSKKITDWLALLSLVDKANATL